LYVNKRIIDADRASRMGFQVVLVDLEVYCRHYDDAPTAGDKGISLYDVVRRPSFLLDLYTRPRARDGIVQKSNAIRAIDQVNTAVEIAVLYHPVKDATTARRRGSNKAVSAQLGDIVVGE
jgi:hypothetical protein